MPKNKTGGKVAEDQAIAESIERTLDIARNILIEKPTKISTVNMAAKKFQKAGKAEAKRLRKELKKLRTGTKQSQKK